MQLETMFCACLVVLALRSGMAQSEAPAYAPAQEGTQPIYYHTQRFSQTPVIEYPGGTYKSSNAQNFPASTTMSGSLIELYPGGMREPHWHEPNEWAYVINGTCRATLVNEGPTHPAESWDFQVGDIWYFPSNLGHAVLGLDDGCTYIAAYDVGDFDEMYNSRGISNWLSTTPPAIVAQAFGISQSEVEAMISPGINGFMPIGDLAALTAGQSDPPLLATRGSPFGMAGTLQTTVLPHRFPLVQGSLPEAENTGGYIKTAQVTNFPASADMAGSFVYADPYSLRQMHWHDNADEWEFLINGTLELGIFNETGQVTQQTLNAGDVGFVPKGQGHWIKNASPDPAYLILVFNNGTFTNIDLPGWLGNFPTEYTAIALNTSVDFVNTWQFSNGQAIVAEDRGNYTQIQYSERELPGSFFEAYAPEAVEYAG